MNRKVKSTQRLLGALLTLVMLLGLVPAMGITVSAERSINFHVSTEQELLAAISACENTTVPYTIYLDSDITIYHADIKNQQLTIDLCGHTINGVQDSNALFLIKDGTTLTVKDSVGGGKIIHTIEEASFGGNAMRQATSASISSPTPLEWTPIPSSAPCA